jgi:two-component system chemotaxis response regulator CheY
MNTDIKILIVDDMPAIRKVLRRMLKPLGFNLFVEAGDGKSAWDILESQQIDLIIADWVMPKMTGLELLMKIRSSKAHKTIPFLMLTGEGTKEKIVEAVNAGASNYVVKPFTAEIISNKLEKILK